jgi:hypothetical protein
MNNSDGKKSEIGKVPFDSYLGGGEQLYNVAVSGESGSSRRDYGLPVFEACGTKCAYCGIDLGDSYESWLGISVDHVIPTTSTLKRWGDQYKKWLLDVSNCVTCCRACNEFLNRYKVSENPPEDVLSFFALRNEVFCKKWLHLKKRHQQEREWYEGWKMKRT